MMKQLNYEKDVLPVVRKYQDKANEKRPDIIADEAEKLFSDTPTNQLAEIYKQTNHKWLVLPELNRRLGSKGQLALF